MIEIFTQASLIMLSISFLLNLVRPKSRNILISWFILIVMNSLILQLYYNQLTGNYTYEFATIFVSDMLYGPVLYLYLLVILKIKLNKRILLCHVLLPLTLGFVIFLSKNSDLIIAPSYARIIYPLIPSLIIVIYFVLGLIKIKSELKINNSLPKTRFLAFFTVVNIKLVVGILFYFISLLWFIDNQTIKTKIKSLLTFYYDSIQDPLFVIFCIAVFLYSITEIIWMKKFFIVESTKPSFKQKIEAGYSSYSIIESKFLEEGYYLNSNINTRKFAQALDISSDMLNHILNKNGFKNFSAFANHHRIQIFLRKLENNEHKNVTIDGLASECGFKSKSTFYRIFKQVTNKSPLEYQESLVLEKTNGFHSRLIN